MKKVYVTFTTDVIHHGHLNILNEASKLGKVTAGVFTDEIILKFDRFSVLNVNERMKLILSTNLVDNVIIQDSLSYKKNLLLLRPDFVVHGDNWIGGPLEAIRTEVIQLLNSWNGQLIEIPYTKSEEVYKLERKQRELLGLPENRRKRLRHLLTLKNPLNVIEVHNGLTGLIAEKTIVDVSEEIFQYDAMWLSSLCDSTAKGKPDIELIDMTSRLTTIQEIFDVTTKPLILDGDTGGLIEHLVYNVKTLERIGVSAIIIEDKIGLKRNSLFGADANQEQDSMENFSKKIKEAKQALRTQEMMIIARVESLILKKGHNDALERAIDYVKAGADGIMIHSKEKNPDEIIKFCVEFRKINKITPLIVVPSTYNSITAKELASYGVNIIIYANHLIRSAFPAMVETAKDILKFGRSLEAEDRLLPIKDAINLID